MYPLAELFPDGVARRDDITRVTSSSSVGRWIADGRLVLLAPGILALPDRAAEWVVRARAATLYADAPLSHLSALTMAGLVRPSTGPIHVTVPLRRCLRDAERVIVHRSGRRLVTIRVRGLDLIEPARTAVDAWAWAWSPSRNDRSFHERAVVRQAVIEGVRSRVLREPALRRESNQRSRHPGRRGLRELLDLIVGGCESELEIWGVLHVLPGPPNLPAWVQQHRVLLPDGRRHKVDAAYVEARVAIELDGAAFHGSREDRERDLRRDTALAAVGWIVLRFSYARLTTDPEGCRREIAAAVLARLIR